MRLKPRWTSASTAACSSLPTTPMRARTVITAPTMRSAIKISYGPVDFMRNSVFVFNPVYELPFGRGKKYLGSASRGMNYVVGGWQTEQHHQLEQRSAVDAQLQRVRPGSGRRRLPPNKGMGPSTPDLGSFDPPSRISPSVLHSSVYTGSR